jgi:two-component system CheB/CheR fusion protein
MKLLPEARGGADTAEEASSAVSDYEKMTRAELVQRLRALEQLDSERRLTEAEERVHLIQSVVEQGFSAVLITSGELPDPRVVYINPAFAKATGYAAEKILGRPLSALASLTSVQERLRTGLPRGERFLEEISTYQTAAGERWGEWRVGPVKDKRGQNTHWLIIFRDITDRKRLEKEILEISDRERQRIGQDLHDGLCQHLAGIELMSQVLEQQLAPKSKAAAARAGDIARHVREGISQTRALARGLSPVTLESEGLLSALRELAAGTENMFGVKCRLVCDPPGRVPDPVVATHLYRIAQEAVSNAIKHGQAGEVVIQLQTAGERASLSVRDNGVGFPKVIPKEKGMGLRIMQTRAGMIGGSLTIEKEPAGGATVLCSVPGKA